MMRVFAIILNVALFVMAIMVIAEYGFVVLWSEEPVGFFMTLSFGVPIVSIIALLTTFKRSTLEE